MEVGKRTDFYNALSETINFKDTGLPKYIILLSDGLPTRGVTQPRQVINDISALNDGRISILAFTGGHQINRYLLDFITYKNRGWAEYSYRINLIGKNFAKMYKKVKDPILLKVRYRASGLDAKSMYPQLLPDIFRDTEFTLYGRYTDEDEFYLQLQGEMNEKVNELIVVGSLDKAQEGGSEIAIRWAYNKVYHLISQLEYGQENDALTQEIRTLSKKFRIKTPYSKNIKK